MHIIAQTGVEVSRLHCWYFWLQWFKAAGFEDVQIKRIGPKWYRGVRRHGLIMGCSVTGRKTQVLKQLCACFPSPLLHCANPSAIVILQRQLESCLEAACHCTDQDGNCTKILYLEKAVMPMQAGDSPLQMGAKREDTKSQKSSVIKKLTFPLRLILGSTAGEHVTRRHEVQKMYI